MTDLEFRTRLTAIENRLDRIETMLEGLADLDAKLRTIVNLAERKQS